MEGLIVIDGEVEREEKRPGQATRGKPDYS